MISKKLMPLFAACIFLFAQTEGIAEECCRGLYLKVETGATFPLKTKIQASPILWDASPEGYNDCFSTRPIIGAAIGFDFPCIFSLEANLAYRPNFHYNKFQTSTATATPGFIGNKTREFRLDLATVTAMAYVSGRGLSCLSWTLCSQRLEFYPYLGGGVGITRTNIYDFRAKDLTPVIDPYPAFASENQYNVRYPFTYQLQAGIEMRWCDSWAFSVGYNWFDIAQFNGPRYLRDSMGNALDFGPYEWRIRFRSNELFIAFKFFI